MMGMRRRRWCILFVEWSTGWKLAGTGIHRHPLCPLPVCGWMDRVELHEDHEDCVWPPFAHTCILTPVKAHLII